ncbi:hypothetical protein [Gluconacetobacter sp.]|uniref:hypothetical protein n=1 Tax=Gluconacetobacter sp. TaxID=1935994 RepID=UPI0039EC01B6
MPEEDDAQELLGAIEDVMVDIGHCNCLDDAYDSGAMERLERVLVRLGVQERIDARILSGRCRTNAVFARHMVTIPAPKDVA